MARKLKDQKRSEYDCAAKRCPNPADFARFPELRRQIRIEWQNRLEFMRSGQARARRVAAKKIWKGRVKKQK
jgi:hypothetical protein